MTAGKQAVRPLNTCLRCIRQPASSNVSLPAAPSRFFSSSTRNSEEAQLQKSDQFSDLDPRLVDNKRDEKRLIKTGVLPIGSRRRRAALRTAPDIPFEQLPYQCFQEARKVLQEDRQEKIRQIEVIRKRIANLESQDAAVGGETGVKEGRLRSMRNHLEELKIFADVNDPIVKKRFEDGEGDMNKPIYRYLADRKWRQHKRMVLMQRVTQMNLVPDVLPKIDPVADVDLAFGRRNVQPGEIVDSRVSEMVPRLRVQVFDKGERLVTVVVVDADVPVPEKDMFTYRCHFIASNIPLSPTNTSVALSRLDPKVDVSKEAPPKHIALPWSPPWANKGAPYHRLAVFVLQQAEGEIVDTAKVAKNTKRDGFILRSFMDKHNLKTVGITMFRTQWDEGMAGVMERAGLGDQVNVVFKRKRVEKLPYKKKDPSRYH
ncbi:PEBP-like protein [Lepidopterella palustris CBS 459.81]|uniref:Large ribosomal subunit protein mL38 n=1 Tax=Lepidopterella palustris CBS 459.81 TaxID=1314670 RepID=A0A8E2E3X7_9PEZI|nr:PEBP-like protein [Lepidopterella palustris CBS 459.81]